MSNSTSITTNDSLELVRRPRVELIREAQEAAKAPRPPEPKPRQDRRIHRTPSLRRAAINCGLYIPNPNEYGIDPEG